MTLTQRPFKKLYKSEKEKYLEKSVYYAHRLIENLHKLERHEKANNNSPPSPPKG